jgi:choline dehydrogenase-like flavoprotein
LLSGVGLEEELRKHNIPLIHNLPGVGKDLKDQPNAIFSFEVTPELTDRHFFEGDQEAVRAAEEQWNLDHKGPLASISCSGPIGFVKLDQKSLKVSTKVRKSTFNGQQF